MTYLSEHLSADFMQPGPGPGCIKRILFRVFNHQIVEKRITKLNLHFKLSYLNSNFVLTLGYVNPALNNPAQCFFFRKWEGRESPGTRLIRFLSTVMRVQLTPDNSNQNRFPLDFLHTFTVTQTLDINSNLP